MISLATIPPIPPSPAFANTKKLKAIAPKPRAVRVKASTFGISLTFTLSGSSSLPNARWLPFLLEFRCYENILFSCCVLVHAGLLNDGVKAAEIAQCARTLTVMIVKKFIDFIVDCG